MHFLEVNVEKFSCLHFELPVHFIGLDGDQILQIVVEHGDPVNGRLPFNVWCSFRGSRIRGFLMAAKCVPPAAEISIWVFDYGLILKVIKVEDTSLATVYTDVERGRAGLQFLECRAVLMKRRQKSIPLTELAGIDNADTGRPQTGFNIGHRSHAPGAELIAGIGHDQLIAGYLKGAKGDALNLQFFHCSSITSIFLM